MRYKKLQGKTIFSEWTFKEKPLLSHSNHISDVPWVIGKPQNAESLSQHRHEQPEVKFGNIFKSIFFFSTVRWIILNWLIYFFPAETFISLLLSFQVFLLKAKARRPLIITPTTTTMLTTNMLMRPTNKKRSSIETQSSFPRPPACSSTRGRQSSFHAWLTNWVSYCKPSENFVATTLIIYRLHYVGEMK